MRSFSMGSEVGNNKFTWVIKNFSSLGLEKVNSDEFVIGGCKWRLMAFPKGNNIDNHLALYLAVADTKYLQLGWRRHAKFSCTIVNQFSEKLSLAKEMDHWFDLSGPDWGYKRMINLDRLKSKNCGFMVDGQVKIVAEVHVLEVIGELDVRKETQPRKKMKLNDDGVVTSDLPKETPAGWVDVNGFQVLPSQVELVKRIFEKHPDMALEFRAKNQNLKTACMNVLLNLIDTMCQSLQDLSTDDLVGAESALTYVKDSGFKVDWLEQKLVEIKEKKSEEQIGVTRIQELEEEVKDLKQKWSDKEALLEKEKAKVLAIIATPLTLDDVVY